MNAALVSIIMPAFNAQRYIAEAVQSVVAQSYPHWELLVVDDGSSDDTVRIAESFAQRDSRVKLLRNAGRKGVSSARNTGIDRSEGEFVGFLDADDGYGPGSLEDRIRFLQKRP